MSKISRRSSSANEKIGTNMSNSRLLSKREVVRSVDIENDRFVKQLVKVHSTINTREQNRSFSTHMRRSQMISKFKRDDRTGSILPKNGSHVEKRIRLEPLHQKLKLTESRLKSH